MQKHHKCCKLAKPPSMVTEPMHVCQDQACSRLPRSTLAGPGTIASASKSKVLVNKNIVTSKTVAEKPCFDSISTYVFQLSTLNIIVSYSVLCFQTGFKPKRVRCCAKVQLLRGINTETVNDRVHTRRSLSEHVRRRSSHASDDDRPSTY